MCRLPHVYTYTHAFLIVKDIHIEPDWLLIYKADDENLWLIRTGSHADLFGG